MPVLSGNIFKNDAGLGVAVSYRPAVLTDLAEVRKRVSEWSQEIQKIPGVTGIATDELLDR
jgi:hypothetical protein